MKNFLINFLYLNLSLIIKNYEFDFNNLIRVNKYMLYNSLYSKSAINHNDP